MTRRLLLVVLLFAGFFGVTATAYAEPSPPPKCFQSNAEGDLPTCTYEGGSWKVSYDSGGFGDSGGNGGGGIPAGFVAFAVLAVIAGIGVTIWRVSMARNIARGAGMDPNQATAVTLLGNEGLDAAYLAANLRARQADPGTAPTAAPATGSAPRTVADRLGELQRLRDQGLVTEAEYDAQRKAIVGSV
jgi:hypothetical protein